MHHKEKWKGKPNLVKKKIDESKENKKKTVKFLHFDISLDSSIPINYAKYEEEDSGRCMPYLYWLQKNWEL